jgi:hypothetical protein
MGTCNGDETSLFVWPFDPVPTKLNQHKIFTIQGAWNSNMLLTMVRV